MAVVPSKGNLPLCTTHPRYAKFNSSPRIQGTQGFFRLEANLICVLSTQQSVGSPTDGPICNPSHKSTSRICNLETRHRSGSDRHFLSRLDLSKGYAFHPCNLVSLCLIQVGEQNLHQLCIVTPIWETQPWYPLLMELSIDYPCLFPMGPRILNKGETVHPLPHLQLAGLLVSANATLHLGFQPRLKTYSCQPVVIKPLATMSQPGGCGVAGVINSKSIHFLPIFNT